MSIRARLFPLLMLLATLPALPASAASPCRDPQTQADLTQCAGEDYRKADRELNAVYAQVLKKLPPEFHAALKKAQQAWIKSRDADCELEPWDVEGGSMWPMSHTGCMRAKTVERTAWLRQLIDESRF